MKKNFVFALVLILSLGVSGCMMNVPNANFTVGEIHKFKVPAGCDGFAEYFPDGKLCLVSNKASGTDDNVWQMFWAERENFRTIHESTWPEEHYPEVKSENKIHGENNSNNIASVENYSNNGAWLIGVYPLDDKGKYVGFYHGESWLDENGTAYKTIGVAYSLDYGENWDGASPIIVDEKSKAQSTTWSGLGDGCVIRDEKHNRWICYYQAEVSEGILWFSWKVNKICMAVSYDENGASGTWKKWDGNDFTITGYDSSTGVGGKNVAVKNLDKVAGANPSVMWNTYLNCYVMAYHSWEGKIQLAFSYDGINWSNPVCCGNGMYPNLISEQGDTVGGETIRMYFATDMNIETGKRKLAYSEVKFY